MPGVIASDSGLLAFGILRPELFLQFVAQRGSAAARLTRVLLHRLVFLFHIFGANRQRQFTVLTVDGGDLRLDFIAIL
jgi:hypothetical protein